MPFATCQDNFLCFDFDGSGMFGHSDIVAILKGLTVGWSRSKKMEVKTIPKKGGHAFGEGFVDVCLRNCVKFMLLLSFLGRINGL